MPLIKNPKVSAEEKELIKQQDRLFSNVQSQKGRLNYKDRTNRFPKLANERHRLRTFWFTYSQEYRYSVLTGQEFCFYWLAYIGHSLEDIAAFMNSPLKSVMKYVDNARRKLDFHQESADFFKNFCKERGQQ